MEFFKKFFVRLKSKIKYFLGTFFVCFVLFLVPNVYASELLFGSGTAYVTIANGGTTYISTGDTTNNMPKIIYGLTGNGDLNLGTLSLGLYNDYDMFPNGMNYSYLIFDTCLNGSINVVISNSSCNNSCVATGTYKAVAVTGSSCTTGGYSGTRYYIQVPIQKWYYNENAETYTASSYIHLTNNVSWAVPVTINNMFLSDEDFTVVYSNQAALLDKLNSVQTAITNMQNSINSNANSNAQNIINNQNANAAQAHSDSQAIKNSVDSIKNQDHSYSQNAADTPSGQSDITNVTDSESDLIEDLNLDASSLDVSLNANTTNFIWDIVTSLRSTNGKITLLFTSILSLAIIKMVLNR